MDTNTASNVEQINDDMGNETAVLALVAAQALDCTELVSATQQETPKRGFQPKAGSIYHTGDFKKAISQAVRDLVPRERDESLEAYFVRTNEHELWKQGMEFNRVLMSGRDHELRAEMQSVEAVLEAYGEPTPDTPKAERYTHMMCSAFLQRGQAILEARQADRDRRRARDVEGFFSMAARVHQK
jgi:hypothetical protein